MSKYSQPDGFSPDEKSPDFYYDEATLVDKDDNILGKLTKDGEIWQFNLTDGNTTGAWLSMKEALDYLLPVIKWAKCHTYGFEYLNKK